MDGYNFYNRKEEFCNIWRTIRSGCVVCENKLTASLILATLTRFWYFRNSNVSTWLFSSDQLLARTYRRGHIFIHFVILHVPQNYFSEKEQTWKYSKGLWHPTFLKGKKYHKKVGNSPMLLVKQRMNWRVSEKRIRNML